MSISLITLLKHLRQGDRKDSPCLPFSLPPRLPFSHSPHLLITLITLIPLLLFSQISQKGTPESFRHNLPAAREHILTMPERSILDAEDQESEKNGLNRRIGIAVFAGLDIMNDGDVFLTDEGTQIWRLEVTCSGALAIGLHFDRFILPEGFSLYAYSPDKNSVLGAYTLYNCKPQGIFSTELTTGDRVIIELNAIAGADISGARCHLGEISCVYRDLPDRIAGRSSSDDCEVNINCPEGDNWQFQKQGVVRIYVRDGGGFFWCTGSLVNNTRQDNTPFLLTADHCAPYVTPEELAQWIFYFNYEYPGCENISQTPELLTMNGAAKLANYDTSGSDFLLLRLDNEVPPHYDPFFNGWSIENAASFSGVTIHHPAGDVKKISTYTDQLTSSQWSGEFGTHWQVYWSATESGWGVTEGGSSGSPLFDNYGRIIGTLTGGQAACEPGGGGPNTGPDQPDFYGKFSYSWDQNGTDSSQQLKYWLDPDNTGISFLPGKFTQLTAAFNADPVITLIGNDVIFTDYSSGDPMAWEWYFEGGDPETYNGDGPVTVNYPNGGKFDVRLTVTDGIAYDTLYLKDYIHIVGKVYPNPTDGLVSIYITEELPSDIKAEVFTIPGLKVFEQAFTEQTYPLITLDLSGYSSGLYLIRLTIKQRYLFVKVIVR